jgi:hypothetical protein
MILAVTSQKEPSVSSMMARLECMEDMEHRINRIEGVLEDVNHALGTDGTDPMVSVGDRISLTSGSYLFGKISGSGKQDGGCFRVLYSRTQSMCKSSPEI